MSDKQTWLTQGAYDRLKSELDELTGAGRKEIAARIEAARDEGDLKENGGYHAAKDQQGQMEARIRDLEELLKHAKVGEAPQASGVVEIPPWQPRARRRFRPRGVQPRESARRSDPRPESRRVCKLRSAERQSD